MKGFAIHNAPTDHGGFIPSTQVRSSQQGNLFVRAGDGHFCPKCKCWSTVVKSHDHVIFDGKAVAYVGDKLTCGARIQPQQSHVVGDGGGANYKSVVANFRPTSLQQNLNNNFASKQSLVNDDDKAYYKWWWGKLESKNPKTKAQEKNSFLQNFSDLHDEYAFGKKAIKYEIDPKAWDGEVAFVDLPKVIQESIDTSGYTLSKAIKSLAVGQSTDVVLKDLSFGRDYLKTIRTKQWPHGRWACDAIGKLTKLGKDKNGKYDFQFSGYLKIKEDLYSWNSDFEGYKNLGISTMSEIVRMATGKSAPSPVYTKSRQDESGLPTVYMRQYYFDYYKKGVNPPKY